MGLRRVIEFIKSHEKELVLFNVRETDSLLEEVSSHLAAQNVHVRTARTASGAPQIAVLSNDESVLAVDTVSTLRDELAPLSGRSNQRAVVTDTQSSRFLNHLKESTFTSYDRRQLLHASREIEDRARRVGGGTIHAGFQRVSRMIDQQRVYANLAQCGVEVHAYGIPDVAPPELGSGQIHAIESDELAQSWFVVFDAGSNETQKTALLAQEATPDAFFGAWTYDPQLVDQLCTYLEQTYVSSADNRHPSHPDDRYSSGA